MLTRSLLAALAVASIALTAPVEAKPNVRGVHSSPAVDARPTSNGYAPARSNIDVAAIPAYPIADQAQRQPSRAASRRVARPRADRQAREGRQASPEASYGEMTFLPHPAGCPARNFCACGAAVEIFGEARRDLWQVTTWLGFERAPAAPGNVAIPHRHHLFVLDRHVEGTTWWAKDFNSGGHLSRRQLVDVAGATIVNPRSTLASYSARKHRTAHRHRKVRLARYGR